MPKISVRRPLITAVSCAVVLSVVWLWPNHHHNSRPAASHPSTRSKIVTSPAPANTPAPTPVATPVATVTGTPSAPRGVNFGDPTAVAAAYVTHAQSLDWHWNGAAGYLPAIRPLSTPLHWAHDLAPMINAPSGATWEEAKADHVTWAVTVSDSFVNPEAPRTAASCWVRVVYDVLLTADDQHGRPGGVPEIGYLNVALQHMNGRWLVAQTSTDGG
ncbi:hypothetical protein SAMN05892883_1148 [Jatrophihabitans sp. GAS493]|uniref:hypothetical protein n=1 Tax=Jatrophihabitans sp. GAS493 TaxID=1907575 RepID=UPI000BB8C9A5|nr:hypothetical protein [Jatrophihabitans sp. GAS493]SOD71659.1 hypothetical protein SAMN05892883_1148 [Jatrophihabitans sp. GAS493]